MCLGRWVRKGEKEKGSYHWEEDDLKFSIIFNFLF